MSKFKPGPWASEKDYEMLGTYEPSELASPEVAHALKSASRCMGLVPILVEALGAVEWAPDAESGEYDYCRMCNRFRSKGHTTDCMTGNALEMARGEG